MDVPKTPANKQSRDEVESISNSPEKPRNKNYIVVIDTSRNLTTSLPDGMVYWSRCETRLEPEVSSSVTNEMLVDFYSTEFAHYDDVGEVGRVSDNPPFFRNKPMFADNSTPRYVSKTEERIYTEN